MEGLLEGLESASGFMDGNNSLVLAFDQMRQVFIIKFTPDGGKIYFRAQEKETADVILTDAHKIPILAMTADVYDEDIQKTREAGMDGHLAKPLDVEKMIWQLSGYRG